MVEVVLLSGKFPPATLRIHCTVGGIPVDRGKPPHSYQPPLQPLLFWRLVPLNHCALGKTSSRPLSSLFLPSICDKYT